MRWFKHMTDTKCDEKIVALLSDTGMEGYGFYWSIIELVAKQMEKHASYCSVTYPLTYLSRQLYLHHNKVSNLLGKLQVIGLIKLSKSEVDGGVNYTITCPNLLKYRDEWAARKSKTPERLPSNSRVTPEQDIEAEAEADIEAEAEADIEAEAEAEAEACPAKNTFDVSDFFPEHEAPTPEVIPEDVKNIHSRLLMALNKISLTPEEILIGEKLIAVGCTFEDIKAARKEQKQSQVSAECCLRNARQKNPKKGG